MSAGNSFIDDGCEHWSKDIFVSLGFAFCIAFGFLKKNFGSTFRMFASVI